MVDITPYLPPEIKESPDAQEITRCENPEFDLLDKRAKRTAQSLFPLLTDEQGIRVFENWLGLNSYLDLTLEQRRLKVLAKLNERLPYTWIKLHKILGVTIGYENFELSREGARVICKLFDSQNVKVVNEIFESLIPMNLYWILVDKPRHTNFNINTVSLHKITTRVTTKPVSTRRYESLEYVTVGSIIRQRITTR